MRSMSVENDPQISSTLSRRDRGTQSNPGRAYDTLGNRSSYLDTSNYTPVLKNILINDRQLTKVNSLFSPSNISRVSHADYKERQITKMPSTVSKIDDDEIRKLVAELEKKRELLQAAKSQYVNANERVNELTLKNHNIKEVNKTLMDLLDKERDSYIENAVQIAYAEAKIKISLQNEFRKQEKNNQV